MLQLTERMVSLPFFFLFSVNFGHSAICYELVTAVSTLGKLFSISLSLCAVYLTIIHRSGGE